MPIHLINQYIYQEKKYFVVYNFKIDPGKD